MNYDFKRWPELLWAGAVAAIIVAASIVEQTNFDAVTDWSTWGIALAGAAGRAAIVGVVTTLRGKQE